MSTTLDFSLSRKLTADAGAMSLLQVAVYTNECIRTANLRRTKSGTVYVNILEYENINDGWEHTITRKLSMHDQEVSAFLVTQFIDIMPTAGYKEMSDMIEAMRFDPHVLHPADYAD